MVGMDNRGWGTEEMGVGIIMVEVAWGMVIMVVGAIIRIISSPPPILVQPQMRQR